MQILYIHILFIYIIFSPKVFGIIIMFSNRPCPAEPGKVRYQFLSQLLSSSDRKGIN